MSYHSDLDLAIKEKEKYNGWTNYATWRINLEIFDGFETQDYYDDYKDHPPEFAEFLKDYADEIISMDQKGLDNQCLALSYARAFLDEVNWYEIAEHLLDAEKENIKNYEENNHDDSD